MNHKIGIENVLNSIMKYMGPDLCTHKNKQTPLFMISRSFDVNHVNIKFDDIVISLNPETLNNIETIASTLRNNHLGTEVVVKYDEHYKLNWEEVADKLVGAFSGYVWCKGGFETYLLPNDFYTEKLYEFNR